MLDNFFVKDKLSTANVFYIVCMGAIVISEQRIVGGICAVRKKIKEESDGVLIVLSQQLVRPTHEDRLGQMRNNRKYISSLSTKGIFFFSRLIFWADTSTALSSFLLFDDRLRAVFLCLK